MANADDIFRKTVLRFTIAGLLVIVYLIFADFFFPLTPHSRVYLPITQVAPDVSGQVVNLHIENNQYVKKGEPLFSLDATSYQQDVYAAQLQLNKAKQNNQKLFAQIIAAQSEVKSAKAQVSKANDHAKRISELDINAISKDERNSAFTMRDQALAELEYKIAKQKELEVEFNKKENNSVDIQIAQQNLSIANRELKRTVVIAATDGKVTNLQLHVGDYATKGVPVLAMVQNKPIITADFREKTLSHVEAGDIAYISFDKIPGKVFSGKVQAIESGIEQGQLNANASLAATTQTDRWLRRAERLRVDILIDDMPDDVDIASGSRCTVQLIPNNNILTRLIGQFQIHLGAIFKYVY